MDQHYDEFFEKAPKASDKGKLLKLPRFQANLRYNFDGPYSYRTKIAHLDLPGMKIIKLGKCGSVTSTMHYLYARRLLEDRYGFQEILLD